MIYAATSSSSWLSSWLHQHGETLLSFALGTAATVVVAVIIARRQRRPKTLDYEILANSPIISNVSRQLGTGLRVSWGTDAHPLSWPRLTVLIFKNTGRRGIRREEILEPLSITVTGASKVVDATVTAVSAAHVHELGQREVTRTGEEGHFTNVCALEPDTFNPGDWVEVQLIVDGEHGDIEVEGMVYEADRIRDYQAPAPVLKRIEDALQVALRSHRVFSFLVALYVGMLTYMFGTPNLSVVFRILLSIGLSIGLLPFLFVGSFVPVPRP
jgi:hypothetical protein